MEKINIAELLKDCPTGMELDSPMYDNLYFDKVEEDYRLPISCYTMYHGSKTSVFFTEFGSYNEHKTAKCVIFPKGKTTWEGFVPPCQFKDGDVISDGKFIAIFHKFEDDHLYYRCWYNKTTKESKYKTDFGIGYYYEYTYATEEEKEKLFQAIKDNGYKWNAETKTLKKLIQPQFKVGNVIQDKDGYKVRITEVNIEDECYGYESLIAKGIGGIAFREQDNWELVPNKFNINTLIPFESKVLVRHNKDNKWTGSFFSFIDRDLHSHCYKFVTTADKSYPMMIPFKGNEYLLGKTDDCQDFYKTWE